MPLDRLFRKEAEAAANESDELLAATQEEIVEVYRALEVYETSAWEKVDALLEHEMRRAYTDMMVGDPDEMILARERARVVSRLREKPNELRAKLADLKRQAAEIEGEAE